MTIINSQFNKIDLDMKVLSDPKLKELIKNNRLLRLGDYRRYYLTVMMAIKLI